jgi:hypothetical protein
MKKIAWLIVLMLGGCQTGPRPSLYKAGTTYTQRQSEYDSCKIQSFSQIPQNVATNIVGGYSNPGTVYCNKIGNGVTCNNVGAVNIPARAESYDVNQGLRDRFIADCMANKGYRIVTRNVCSTEKERSDAGVNLDG